MQHNQTQAAARRGRKAKPIDTQRLALARYEANSAHDKLGTWADVAEFYGISKAAAHRIANDKTYRPSQTTIDKVLARLLMSPKPKRPPRRFYRPCLSVTWGETIKQSGWNIETIIAAGLKVLGAHEA